MTRKRIAEDRPGWRYYRARRKVNEMIDALILESFAVCRDSSLIVRDPLLHERFCDLRAAADRLTSLLAQRENTEVNKGRNE